MQQQPRVEAHRATNIANDHEWAWLVLNLSPGQFDQLSPVLEVLADHPSHIRIRSAANRLLATRRPHSQVPAHLCHQLFGLLHLFPRKGLEVLLSQDFDGAVGRSLRSSRIVILLLLNLLMSATRTLALSQFSTQVFT